MSANHILYAVNGPIKQALTPTPIKILDMKRLEKFLDNAKAVTPIKAINKKEETIFLGPCLSSKYPSGICIEPKPKKYPPAKSPRSAA